MHTKVDLGALQAGSEGRSILMTHTAKKTSILITPMMNSIRVFVTLLKTMSIILLCMTSQSGS